MSLWFVFGVPGTVPEVLKMLVFFFPVFWAFVVWFILVYFGFGRFRGFCVSCVCFCFLCCFCFCFVCFVFVLLLDCFLVLVIVLFLFLFILFLFLLFLFFLEGLRVSEVAQRATSLGPKPSLFYFCLFVCLCFFRCLHFFFFYRRINLFTP